MNTMTLGLFHTREEAEGALKDLMKNGFESKDISIMMKDQAVAADVAKNTGGHVAGGAATGAAAGGILGGLAGLLIGIGAIAIPGVGGFLIAGPIATALGITGATATTVSGALSGALAGGLAGALVGIGLPEEDAKMYEKDLQEGAILLATPSAKENENSIKRILQENHADQIRTINIIQPKI